MSIAVSNLSIRFKDKPILEQVNFAAKPGEFIALCGPNGAGKSTLLKAISNELPVLAGEVFINQKPVTAMSALDLAQKRAVMPQHVDIQVSFKARELIEMGLHLIVSPKARNAVFELAVDMLSLTDLLDRNYLTLSGGQKQRVQLARVLVQVLHNEVEAPRYLLLDECTSAMDMAMVNQVFSTLQSLIRERQTQLGIIAVIHDINIASIYTDKIALIHDRQISDFDCPENTVTAPILQRVFAQSVDIVDHPQTLRPIAIPLIV